MKYGQTMKNTQARPRAQALFQIGEEMEEIKTNEEEVITQETVEELSNNKEDDDEQQSLGSICQMVA